MHQSLQLLHQNLIVPLVVYVGGLDVYFIFVFNHAEIKVYVDKILFIDVPVVVQFLGEMMLVKNLNNIILFIFYNFIIIN